MTGAKIFFLFSFFIAFIITTIQFLNTLKLKDIKNFTESQGNPVKGILYSFTMGMAPWKKESAHKHIISYSTGIIFHAAVLTAFLLLISVFIRLELPERVKPFLELVIGIGILTGTGLILKRIISHELKSFSNPEDYFTTLLVTLFLISAFVFLYNETYENYFLILSGILMLYIPVGKIKHFIFFFYSRILLGINFGRKGVFSKRKI